jgi:hypothetical protein
MLMSRLKNHEPETYSSAAALLQTGTMPDLLFRQESCTVNPALLYLMHASQCASISCHTSLPAMPGSVAPVSGPQLADCAQQTCGAGECKIGAVGEVWWLFDAGIPYLAEVFKGGAVPEGRLPHMDKRSIRGRHVARILGRQFQFVKMVASTARMCLFSAWCGPPECRWFPARDLRRVRVHCAHTTDLLLECRTSNPEEAAIQAGMKVRARGGGAASTSHAVTEIAGAALREAAALHHLRTGEEVGAQGGVDTAAVIQMLRLEALGESACGDCARCMEGASCKRVSNREASKRGKRGAIWAEEAECLMGREFQVCRRPSDPENVSWICVHSMPATARCFTAKLMYIYSWACAD